MLTFSQLHSNISNESKPRRSILVLIFTLFLTIPGKVNLRNMARYTDRCEKTFQRNFRQSFNFIEFNFKNLSDVIPKTNRKAIAIDASFCAKSGKKTHGLANFWNGIQSRSEKGLEFSTIAHIDVDHRSAYALDTRQTPAKNASALRQG